MRQNEVATDVIAKSMLHEVDCRVPPMYYFPKRQNNMLRGA